MVLTPQDQELLLRQLEGSPQKKQGEVDKESFKKEVGEKLEEFAKQ